MEAELKQPRSNESGAFSFLDWCLHHGRESLCNILGQRQAKDTDSIHNRRSSRPKTIRLESPVSRNDSLISAALALSLP